MSYVHAERLRSIKELSEGIKVECLLDVGCAEEPLTKHRVKSNLRVAFDVRSSLISKWKAIPDKQSIYLIADAEAPPFKDECFDYIFAGEIIEHLKHPKCFLTNLNRILKNGGFLLLDTPNRDVTKWIEIITHRKHGLSVGHTREFSYKQACILLRKSGFRIIKSLGVYLPLSLFLPVPVIINLSMALGKRVPKLSYLVFYFAQKNVHA